MNTSIEDHYNESYFNDSQKHNGELGGRANLFKFKDYINKKDRLLDFGCGGGFLLKNINCDDKMGVELNPIARKYCVEENNITCYSSLDKIENDSIDVIISNHCLEHTIGPYEIIKELYKKLKKGGKIIIVVPLDSYTYVWKPNDICNHLYSFSPMNLGNILQGIGFENIKSKPILHKWIPKRNFIIQYLGFNVFDKLSWFYGNFIYNNFPIRKKTKWNQVWCYGEK
jgi:SAM-dependent methyltransferase